MSKIRQFPQFIFVVIIIALVVLGVLIADDFGISWDEISEREYGWDSLDAYGGGRINWESYNIRKYYGPFYLMVSNIIAISFTRISSSWDIYEAGHYLNYLVFLASGLLLYYLLSGITSKVTSVFTSTLFLSQPLLFGHGFINHKDIPFMTLFIAAITFGMLAYRGMKRFEKQFPRRSQEKVGGISKVKFQVMQTWNMTNKRTRIIFALVSSILLIILIDLFLTNSIIMLGLRNVVVNAYHGESLSAINRLFELIAENSQQVGLDAYLSKLQALSTTLRNLSALAMGTIFLLLSMWSFPSLREWLWDKITIDSLKVWLNSKALPLLLLSAIASGFATSVRPLGFLAFMLIGGILLFEFKSRSLFPLTLGIGILSLTCILSWPAIWEAPFSRFHESLALASNHPWRGEVLYRGVLYVGGTLPWHYLPTMLLSQLTEPVYILILFGVFVAIREWRDESARELALVAIWFLVPILAAIISGAVLFDNFRQFLFVIPAVFVFVAVGIDRILEKLRYPAVNIPLMLLFVLPGFNAIQKLHPYQYIYYNAGVGGIRGAYRHYELDYWCTSYLDAFEYINQQLSENVTLDVWGADRTAEYYARADIKVVKIDEEILMEYDDTSFVLLPTRRNIDWSIPDQNTELESVELLGIPLAKIYAP